MSDIKLKESRKRTIKTINKAVVGTQKIKNNISDKNKQITELNTKEENISATAYAVLFQEDNIVSQDWIDKVKNLKDILLRYSKPQRDEDGDVAIIDISLYPFQIYK